MRHNTECVVIALKASSEGAKYLAVKEGDVSLVGVTIYDSSFDIAVYIPNSICQLKVCWNFLQLIVLLVKNVCHYV